MLNPYFNISYAAPYRYDTIRETDLSKKIFSVLLSIKEDRVPWISSLIQRMIERKLHEDIFSSFFGANVVLVPVPGHGVTVNEKTFTWPSRSICSELQKNKLAGSYVELVKRVQTVNKSATSKSYERPSPNIHYDSIEIQEPRLVAIPGDTILLVDDVITRGSTILGVARRIREALPNHKIMAFGLVLPAADKNIKSLNHPQVGIVRVDTEGRPIREP